MAQLTDPMAYWDQLSAPIEAERRKISPGPHARRVWEALRRERLERSRAAAAEALERAGSDIVTGLGAAGEYLGGQIDEIVKHPIATAEGVAANLGDPEFWNESLGQIATGYQSALTGVTPEGERVPNILRLMTMFPTTGGQPGMLSARWGVDPRRFRTLVHGTRGGPEAVANIKKVGFDRGESNIEKIKGTSVTSDPYVAAREGFGKYDPESIVKVDPLFDPKRVRNLSPAEFAMALHKNPQDFGEELADAYSKPNSIWDEGEIALTPKGREKVSVRDLPPELASAVNQFSYVEESTRQRIKSYIGSDSAGGAIENIIAPITSKSKSNRAAVTLVVLARRIEDGTYEAAGRVVTDVLPYATAFSNAWSKAVRATGDLADKSKAYHDPSGQKGQVFAAESKEADRLSVLALKARDDFLEALQRVADEFADPARPGALKASSLGQLESESKGFLDNPALEAGGKEYPWTKSAVTDPDAPLAPQTTPWPTWMEESGLSGAGLKNKGHFDLPVVAKVAAEHNTSKEAVLEVLNTTINSPHSALNKVTQKLWNMYYNFGGK